MHCTLFTLATDTYNQICLPPCIDREYENMTLMSSSTEGAPCLDMSAADTGDSFISELRTITPTVSIVDVCESSQCEWQTHTRTAYLLIVLSAWDDFIGSISPTKLGHIQLLPIEGLGSEGVRLEKMSSEETAVEGTTIHEINKWMPRTWEELASYMDAHENIIDAVLRLPDGFWDQIEAASDSETSMMVDSHCDSSAASRRTCM